MNTAVFFVPTDDPAYATWAEELARRGRWEEMPGLITDKMLDVFAVSGTWAELPGKIQERYGRLLDRVSYYLPFVPGENDDG